jgi:alkylhydroperoxidase family enzyme
MINNQKQRWRKNKMARVKLLELEETSGAERERYEELAGRNAVTNMKAGLLNDAATYDAYMGWYTSWNRLVEVIGEKDAILYAHSISTTNSCQLCSLFFISDVKGLGLDPANLQYDEKEQVLAELGQQAVKNPTAVSDDIFDRLRKFWTDQEIVVIVGFAGQMIATNNFNSILKIDVDKRLLPIINEFKPQTWRDDIK